jgi:hypothetical protein
MIPCAPRHGLTTGASCTRAPATLPSIKSRDKPTCSSASRTRLTAGGALPLNLPTAAFSATDTPLNDALHTVLQAVTPSVFYPHEDIQRSGRPIDVPVSVAFPGGTMLEALNAIVRAHQSAEWQFGYSGNSAMIALDSLAFTGGGVMAPVALPPTRR